MLVQVICDEHGVDASGSYQVKMPTKVAAIVIDIKFHVHLVLVPTGCSFTALALDVELTKLCDATAGTVGPAAGARERVLQ